MDQNRVRTITFLVVLLGITLLFFRTVWPLLSPIFYGLVFAIVLHPLHKRVTGWFGGRESLSAFTTMIVSAVVLLLLGTTIGVFLFKDATVLFNTVSDRVDNITPVINNAVSSLQAVLPPAVAEQLGQINVKEQIVNATQSVARSVFQGLQSLVGNIVIFVAFLLVTLYSTFFFLRDGKKWAAKLFKLIPLPDQDDKSLAEAFVGMTRTALKMVFVMGAIQGVLGGLIFWILGITAPVFWGLIFALASLLPGVGHPTIWIPAAIILFVTGQPLSAVILIVYGAVVMGLSDDLLRPYLLSRGAEVNPYIMLLSTLGGVIAFGFTGLILGPVIAALALATWKLYEKKYA